MKFALVNNERSEAFKGGKGYCPVCDSEMIAHCGEIKVHHWKHKRKVECDHWWENETEWHRRWKNQFPKDWQEVVLQDKKTNEKHIADVRATDYMVLEFQHSSISLEERKSREYFYKHMTWVIDAAKGYNKFIRNKKHLKETDIPNIYQTDYPEQFFPKAWINSEVPVIFDFLGLDQVESKLLPKYKLYCLFPNYGGTYRIAEINRSSFIKSIHSSEWYSKTVNFLKKETQKDVIASELNRVNANIERLLRKRISSNSKGKSRRF